MNCTCGHTDEEHTSPGENKEYPGSTACQIEGCDCDCFEADGEEEE